MIKKPTTGRRRIDIRNRTWLSAGVSIWTIHIRTMSIVSPSMMIVAARADTGTRRASASA
jgi:hypothetical protein